MHAFHPQRENLPQGNVGGLVWCAVEFTEEARIFFLEVEEIGVVRLQKCGELV